MPEQQIHIDELIIKHLQQSLSDDEQVRLHEWVNASNENKELFDRFTDQPYISNELGKLYSYDDEKGWGIIRRSFSFRDAQSKNPLTRLRIFNWRRLAVAASIILILGIGSYFIFFNKEKQNQIVKTTTKPLPNDVTAPIATKAMITLANGQRVLLDSLSSGTLATQGNVNVLKTADGRIVYSSESGVGSQEMQYNTLFNPRGSKVQPLTLNDGTKVWLNSESSIRFPTAFIGIERKVEITGEAYFEVEKNAALPFRVNVKGMEVEVLGTHFNINAYDDEAVMKTTLLEGAVKIKKDNNLQLLSPGQQAQVNSFGDIKLIKSADLEATIAWKNGKFIFARSDIKTVMRQLEKWYDVEVEYRGDVTKEEFVGVISRSANISEILAMLQDTRTVNFEIIGRKIIVK